MGISIASRLALAGMAGLAALTAAQWMRATLPDPGSMLSLALGVMPSFTAAYAMPLIAASWFPSVTAVSRPRSALRPFAVVLAATTLGLLAWEFVQATSTRLVFDVGDLVATVAGALAAIPAFLAVTRRL